MRIVVTDPDGASVNGSLVLLIVPQGPRLALVGVPDLQVVEGVPKTVDLTPFIKNAKSLASVTLTADNAYATVSGLRVTVLVPAGAPEDAFRVRLTAFDGDACLLGPPALVDDVAGWLRAIAEDAG